MDAKGIERVIVAEPFFDSGTEEPRNEPSGDSDDDRSRGIDEAGSWSHHNETCDRPRTEAQNTRLPLVEIFRHRPDKSGHAGCEGRSHESIRCHTVRGHGGSCVKSVPADPEHSGADHAEDHAVRRHRLFPKTEPLS